MKRLIISVFAVVVALNAGTAFASGEVQSKNDCLLYGKNCRNVSLSLPERIAKLSTEITKGEKVYRPDELKMLELRLKEDIQTMNELQRGGN